MKALAGLLVAIACAAGVWFVACRESPRTPVAAPEIELTPSEREEWAPLPPDRSAIPVVLYQGIGPESDFESADDARVGIGVEDFARQMTMLAHAGYETVELQTFVDFIEGRRVELPPRPLLLTFGDGRADTWTNGDGILAKLGFSAVLFVDVGAVDRGDDDEYLTWDELQTMQDGGRWNLQLHAGEHGHTMTEGGPYYTTLEPGESLKDWQRRVRSDIEWGQEKLGEHIETYEPLAFSPPFGDYGQSDPRMGDDLLGWLADRFDAIFTQDRNARAVPRDSQPVGSIPVERDTEPGDLYEMLLSGEQR
jgi:peptidoglycan/xylan/chitin deacetylase (PgdA/CDA1 family)